MTDVLPPVHWIGLDQIFDQRIVLILEHRIDGELEIACNLGHPQTSMHIATLTVLYPASKEGSHRRVRVPQALLEYVFLLDEPFLLLICSQHILARVATFGHGSCPITRSTIVLGRSCVRVARSSPEVVFYSFAEVRSS